MTFNFDETIDRHDTRSVKWDLTKNVFGRDDLLPLWVADMDFACPPSVVEALTERVKHPIYGYPVKDEDFFVSAINWVKKRFQADISKDYLMTIPGVVPGIYLAIDAFTKPGDKVIIQPPVYHPFFSAVENKGRKLVLNPLKEENGHYEMDLEDLESKIDARTKLLVLCNPHNPIGKVWSREELIKLSEICVKHDIIIVSDEIHSDLVYEKGHHTPFYTLPGQYADQTVTFIAPSKTFNLAGLFTSIAIIENPKLRQAYKTAMENNSMGNINTFGIEAMMAAYNGGEAWLNSLLVYLKGNATYIHEFLKERLPKIKMAVPEATYLGWMDFREMNLYGEELRQFIINEAKLGLNDGVMFGAQGDGFQRINFASPRSVIEKAMHQLEEAVIKREKSKN